MRVGDALRLDQRRLRRGRDQGVTPEEVHHVLVRTKSRIRRHEDDCLRILGRAHTGRLIEVWLREDGDDYWLVVIALTAGLAGQRLYRRMFQE